MITQKDIAKRLGVSPSLVSRSLTGTAGNIGASVETMRRIREEAVRLNYRPSAAALTLRGTPTNTIGIIVKSFSDPFFGSVIGELQTLAHARQYSLALTGCASAKNLEIDTTALLKYQLDGLVVVGSDFEPEGLATFSAKGTPVVQIGDGNENPDIVRIVTDQEFGIRELVAYLKQLGHRDIGYIGDDTPTNLRREKIVREVLNSHDLRLGQQAIARVPTNAAITGYEAMQRLLQECATVLPTAVIAADDVIAQAALRALFEKGIRVPDDISLAGVDDIPSAQLAIPSLTTLRQPIREMVQEAFYLATSQPARARAQIDGTIVIKPELIIRESCVAPRIQ